MDLQALLGDVRVLGVLVGAVVTLLLTRGAEFVAGRLRTASRRRNLIRGLFAEIDFNTRDLEVFLDRSAPPEALAPVLSRNPPVIPHIVDARHTEIYRLHVTDLHHMPDQMIGQIVQFYGILEKLRVQIEAVRWDSFASISSTGRVTAIRIIHDTARAGRDSGLDLITRMQDSYPGYRLQRISR